MQWRIALIAGLAASTGWLAPILLPAGAQTVPPRPPAVAAAPAPRPALLPVAVVARHPHDPAAFTQGLLVHDGQLYESTGRVGQSEVRRVEIATGRVLARASIPADQFGEGLARWGDLLISLTWTDGIAHRWDVRRLRREGRPLRYSGEGWGLATTADGLVFSDGSDELRFLDPDSFAERRRLPVRIGGQPIRQLNELEVVDGRIFANVWMTGFILVIDPDSGVVTHVLDLRPLVAEVAADDRDAVLNGIAWDADNRRLYVTGKLWPTLFEIRLPAELAAPAPTARP